MGKLLEIRKEFGEPFVDVVKGFAEMGYSKTATAKILGIANRYFRDVCRRFDLNKFFPKTASERRRECRGGGIGWPKGKPRETSHNKITDTTGKFQYWPVFSNIPQLSSRKTPKVLEADARQPE